jgi:hypothetical protein
VDRDIKEIAAGLCEVVADYVELKILEHEQWQAHINVMDDLPVDDFHEGLTELREKRRRAKERPQPGELRADLDKAMSEDFKRFRAALEERGQRFGAVRAEYTRKSEALLARMRDSLRRLATRLRE